MRHSIGEHVDGRYRIRALLAEDGMAEVYRAVDTATGQDVVLKVPHASIAGAGRRASRPERGDARTDAYALGLLLHELQWGCSATRRRLSATCHPGAQPPQS
jgi:serine/threonine protein kinase